MTNEKAKSKSQQRFFGMVDAYKKGEMPDASPAIKKAAEGMTKKEVKDFAKTKHKGLPNHVKKKKTIKESQLREMIRNILMESYLDYTTNKDEKQQEIESDWNDIDSWNSKRPTDTAWSKFPNQIGSDTYGKYPGIDYEADDIDYALEDGRYANNNIFDENGWNAMRAMDRLVKYKNFRKGHEEGIYHSGRIARNEETPWQSTNTFDDEIDKYNLNIPKDKIDEAINKTLKKYIK